MRLEVPMIPPSGNEMRRKYRTVFAYRDLRMAWEKALVVCSGGTFAANQFRNQTLDSQTGGFHRMIVSIEIHRPRMLDPDSPMNGIKPVLDALVNVKFLPGDSEKHIEVPRILQVKDRKRCTIIEITPA